MKKRTLEQAFNTVFHDKSAFSDFRSLTDSNNVVCIVDGDVHQGLTGGNSRYKGSTQIICSPVEDIEKYIYHNRDCLLPELLPNYKESNDPERTSKTYWKWLTQDKEISENELYKLVIDNNKGQSRELADKIQMFLQKAN